MTQTREERIADLKERIAFLRGYLFEGQPFSTISRMGYSMSVNRKELLEELKGYESELRLLTRGSSWIRKIDMTGSA
jgi:hypothetical protein